MTVGTQKLTASELDLLVLILNAVKLEYESNMSPYSSYDYTGKDLSSMIKKIEALKKEIK